LPHFFLLLLRHLPTDEEADDSYNDDEERNHAHGDANNGTRADASPCRVGNVVGHNSCKTDE
jgi:hypothetical protein